MKIAVCVKHVPTSENVEIDEKTQMLVRDNAESDTNPCDLNAMEFAIQLKKATDGSVDVFSMGPDNAEASLKKCLALGADQAFLLSDRAFAGGDTLGTARVLAAGIREQGPYDIILTGNESSDGGTGQVGPMIAELLGMPEVAETVGVEAEGSVLHVKRKIETGHLLMDVQTPALLTVPFGANEPTLPTLRAQMKANKKEVPAFNAEALAGQLEGQNEKIGAPAALSVVTDLVPANRGSEAARIEGSQAEIASKINELVAQGGE